MRKFKCADIWKIVIGISVDAEVLGAVATKFEKFAEGVAIDAKTEHVQKTTSLGTTRILRFVLRCQVPWRKKLCVP